MEREKNNKAVDKGIFIQKLQKIGPAIKGKKRTEKHNIYKISPFTHK